ncbi:cytochrome P450 [Aspergillus novofumigatus IBT 16806]|uniref:Cytochrome P450 n=1 Tax=Aspergillus novofumigatus (strain IBT 16806) TaxID=1392255 RepID=A0A2I1BXX3_ASPN1|nr:cytochrome P450 [Aspergillus novofumigatus IBT 16806]PKX90220.1 cytochrome P450 [Aspergillus novofumigatus IBT 16806]
MQIVPDWFNCLKYYDVICASSLRKREKDTVLIKQLDLDGSSFSSIDPVGSGAHPLDRLVYHFKEAHASHQVVSLDAGFAALTSDVIHRYVYGFNPANIDKKGFNAKVRDSINRLFQLAHIRYFFPLLQTIVNMMPLAVLRKVNPPAFVLAGQMNQLYHRVAAALEKPHSNPRTAAAGLPERLMNEGFALVIGGAERWLGRIEAGDASADSRATWKELEGLPYLSGVIAESPTSRYWTGESLHKSRAYGGVERQKQAFRNKYKPPSANLSYFVLADPEIFTDSHEFDPERWIRAAAKRQRLDRYMVNFCTGSWTCTGMKHDPAYAEMFLIIATLAHRFDLELYETPKENIEFARDFGTPYPAKGSLSVRITITVSSSRVHSL